MMQVKPSNNPEARAISKAVIADLRRMSNEWLLDHCHLRPEDATLECVNRLAEKGFTIIQQVMYEAGLCSEAATKTWLWFSLPRTLPV